MRLPWLGTGSTFRIFPTQYRRSGRQPTSKEEAPQETVQ